MARIKSQRKRQGKGRRQNNRNGVKAPPRRAPRSNGGQMGTAAYLRSLTNPWEYSACIPDGAKGTGCFSLKENITIAAGAAGSCGGVYWNPITNALFISDNGNTTATPTIPANWTAATANSSVIAQYGKYRVISGGVRVRYIGNTQTDQGILLLGIASGAVSVSAFNNISITAACNGLMEYKICALREGGEFTWRPMDIVDAEDWTNTSSAAVTNASLFTRPYLVAIVYGGSTAAAYINCEAIYNYEGQYVRQQFISGGVTNAEGQAEVGWYETAMNYVKNVPQITVGLNTALVQGTQIYRGVRAMGNGYSYARQLGQSNNLNPMKFLMY